MPPESQGEKNKDDVSPPESQGEKDKDDVLPPESQGEKNKEDVLPPKSQGEKNKDEIDDKDPIIYLPKFSRQTSDNRYCKVLYINYKFKFFTIIRVIFTL